MYYISPILIEAYYYCIMINIKQVAIIIIKTVKF